ncbi:MAG: serine hydrolase domain-containing protein, partial [Bacillota bacterium]
MPTRRLTLALLRLSFAFMLLALFPVPTQADAVDDFVNAELQKRHIPGLSLAVLHNGQVVKLAGYGLANIESSIPVTPQSVFQIQSITKTFTATAILMLMEEGKLSLDEPVSKYLDGTPESWKPITIRHLLTHTSGIKDFINEPTVSLRLEVTEESVFNTTTPRPLNFPPGERYAYSNTNYHLLVMIIRKLTGQWYGDFLKDRIFTPLGMSNTRIMSHSAIIPNRVSGYHWRDSAFRNGDFVAESVLAYGGGGIVSTATDMAKWASAFESEKLLKKATIEQAWTPAKLNSGKASAYGLGWATEPVDGHRGVGHGGGHMTGFTSYLSIYPDDRLAVVVLTNSTSANPSRIARRVAGLMVPSLAIRLEPPIEDKEPQVTALLRELLIGVAEWRLPEEKFTAELWQVTSQQRDNLQRTARNLGQVKALDLLARTESPGLRTYRYRATFVNGKLITTMTLNGDGKISGMLVE